MADTTPSKDLIAAITSSRDAYFAQRPHLRRTEAADRLFAEAFVLGADSVLDADAAQSDAALPDGWVAVPRDPTPAMSKAAADAWLDCGSRLCLNKAAAAVRAGIAAAPPTLNASGEVRNG